MAAEAAAHQKESMLRGPHDFPPAALEPKVFCGWKPKDPPREDEVARRSQFFLSMNIKDLLEERGLPDGDPSQLSSYLPLEAFDDLEFESMTPAEWVAKGQMDGRCRVPGMAFRQSSGEYGWSECRMLGYDEEVHAYNVQFCDTGIEEKVSRLHLLFFAEDPRVFADRIASAVNRRDAAERRLRYNLYVDCMPTDEMQPLDEEQVARIVNSAMNTEALLVAELDTEQLVNEVDQDYIKVMNEIIFDENLREPSQAELCAQLKSEEERAAEAVVKQVPYSAILTIPDHNFDDQCSEFAQHSFMVVPEVVMCMQQIRAQCNMALEQPLFMTQFDKTLRVDEFESQQASVLKECQHFVKDI
jgi:dynein heavy chain